MGNYKYNEIAKKYQEYLRENYKVDDKGYFTSKKSVVSKLFSKIKTYLVK